MTATWQAPETPSMNRAPMMPFAPADAMVLDGLWSFQLLSAPDEPVTSAWRDMPVPSLWTMQGTTDLPQYTNVQMPFDEVPPHVPSHNPTGVYERPFTVPAAWDGRRVVLRIGGWESFLQVELNGVLIAMAKDGRLAADFDVTDHLVSGENTLRLRVSKWSDATFIEDQDQWWHGGLSRSVTLFSTPRTHVARLHITPTLVEGEGRLHVRGMLSFGSRIPEQGHAMRVRVPSLERVDTISCSSGVPAQYADDEERAKAFAWFTSEYADAGMPSDVREMTRRLEPLTAGTFDATLVFEDVLPWSAESPNLIDVVLEHLDASGEVVEAFPARIGFRSVEVQGRELLVNGAPVLIHGVNRHDFHRSTGRVLTRDDIRADLLELKRWNVNAIRTSHYPNDPALLDLADELGFYVFEEANIESHAHMHTLCDDPRYLAAWVDRVARMVQRDLHHASAIVWSLGNESGYGANHDAAAAWVRRFDPTRPLHYEGAIRGDWTRGHLASDIICPMYPSIDAIVRHATSGRQDRPLIMCEYSHAMGNSNGTLREYWDAIEAHPGLQGGFIWEMWDHGLDQSMPDGTMRSAYGGDFGEERHDGNFCCDGMFFPDRLAKPAMEEFKAIAAPLRITHLGGDRFSLRNRQWFADSSGFVLRWSAVLRDGTVREGVLDVAPVAARASLEFTIPTDAMAMITFHCVLAEDVPWAPAGFEVGWDQALFTAPEIIGRLVAPHAPALPATDVEFGIIAATQLSLWRAPTDNDRIFGISARWDAWGLRELACQQEDEQVDGDVRVVTRSLVTGSGHAVRHERRITTDAEGVLVHERVHLPAELSDVARVGVTLGMPVISDVRWFGRGPQETCPDRTLAPFGSWAAPLVGMHTDYVRPQENGGREDVVWMELAADEAAWAIVQDAPRHMSVSRYSDGQLADVTHNVELVPEDMTYVHIDAAHRGVGTASCGPDTLPQYLVGTGHHEWTWRLRRTR